MYYNNCIIVDIFRYLVSNCVVNINCCCVRGNYTTSYWHVTCSDRTVAAIVGMGETAPRISTSGGHSAGTSKEMVKT